MNLKSHLLNIKYIAIHKYWVFRAGLIFKVPLWRLIKHDWTKLTCAEFPAYSAFFYNKTYKKLTIEESKGINKAFQTAFRHHWEHNDHHWEYWGALGYPVEMPENALREMVADWAGAGRAIKGKWEFADWYEDQKKLGKMQLHPATRTRVEELIEHNKDKFK